MGRPNGEKGSEVEEKGLASCPPNGTNGTHGSNGTAITPSTLCGLRIKSRGTIPLYSTSARRAACGMYLYSTTQ